MLQKMRSLLTRPNLQRFGAYALFWSWNLIFLAFMLLGFAPTILFDLITAVRSGIVPWTFIAFGVIVASIPVFAVILGATMLRKEPAKLLSLGYGLEGPLMIILGIRFFVLQELNPAMTALYVIAGIGLLTFFWQLVDKQIDQRRLLAPLRLIGMSIMLGFGLYASVLLAFYAIPLIVQLISSISEILSDLPEIVSEMWREVRNVRLRDGLFTAISLGISFLLGAFLMAYTATLLFGMPIVVPILYWRGWQRSVAQMRQVWSPALTAGLVVATVAASIAVIAVSVRQPQHRAFALLESPPETLAEAQSLLDSRQNIRAGLLNAYLSPYRYLSAVGEVHHISELYSWVFEIEQPRAASVQGAYELLTRPMLYAPVSQSGDLDVLDGADSAGRTASSAGRNFSIAADSEKAAELYKNFFDQPINRGERDVVTAAVRSTWEAERATAAWQAVDDREVHLVRQEITVDEQGDWAELELYEVYQNQTTEQQEVVYYFSLPESAVMTGVWLGDTPDREERFVYRVAPRGAAQAVYKNELVRRQDPALLEQIGPRQYRLRIFPIPPRQMDFTDRGSVPTFEEGRELHMWLTWRVVALDDGWALPNLAERRNIYWDADSVRLLNSEPFETSAEEWTPLWAEIAEKTEPTIHRMDFEGGQSVVAQPLDKAQMRLEPTLPSNSRIAVVLDRSYSMEAHAELVATELARLAEGTPATDVDLYLTASQFRGEAPSRASLSDVDPAEIVYFGGQNAAELLIQFEELRDEETYDAVLVLTDDTGYELGESDTPIPVPDVPIWMVHVGGGFPLGYDDDTLEAIQSSDGGAVGSIQEAITRIALRIVANRSDTDELFETRDIIDGYLWDTVSTEMADWYGIESEMAIHNDDGFMALGGRRLILAEMQKARNRLDDVTILDELHELAIDNSIVTPYSSMIVLVNERQEKLLDRLEEQGDRFDREHDEVGNTMPESALAVTGVPEPEEWLLILLAVGILGWYLYNQRGQMTTRSNI